MILAWVWVVSTAALLNCACATEMEEHGCCAKNAVSISAQAKGQSGCCDCEVLPDSELTESHTKLTMPSFSNLDMGPVAFQSFQKLPPFQLIPSQGPPGGLTIKPFPLFLKKHALLL